MSTNYKSGALSYDGGPTVTLIGNEEVVLDLANVELSNIVQGVYVEEGKGSPAKSQEKKVEVTQNNEYQVDNAPNVSVSTDPVQAALEAAKMTETQNTTTADKELDPIQEAIRLAQQVEKVAKEQNINAGGNANPTETSRNNIGSRNAITR